MAMRSSELRARSYQVNEGDGRLGGIDVGGYPEHHFARDLTDRPLPRWPLRLLFAGEDYWGRGCYRFRENSETFALEYVREGEFEFKSGETAYRARPGQLFFVRRGAASEIGCFSCDRAMKRVIALDGSLLESLVGSLHLDRADVLTPTDPERVDALFRRAEAVLREDHPERQERGALVAYEVLLTLSRDCRIGSWPEPLGRIVHYLDTHLGEAIAVKALAERFALSPASLHRLFKDHLNETPINYLIHKRIEVAKHMLRLTELPIKEIATQVGFANVFYFSATFARLAGAPPRQFRRSRPL